jgi:hypothetical protein
MSTEKKELIYSLGEGLDKLPERHYQKRSKYLPILESTFTARYTPVIIEGIDANYISTQLKKIIKTHGITGLGVATSNGVCYIEKEPKTKVKIPKS